jgi:hypothetical protein
MEPLLTFWALFFFFFFEIDYHASWGAEPHVALLSQYVYVWFYILNKVYISRISLSHNQGLSLQNVYCSVKYEHAKVVPRSHHWVCGSASIVNSQRYHSHRHLICHHNAEFHCQQPRKCMWECGHCRDR